MRTNRVYRCNVGYGVKPRLESWKALSWSPLDTTLQKSEVLRGLKRTGVSTIDFDSARNCSSSAMACKDATASNVKSESDTM
jgi:hypothetical protein